MYVCLCREVTDHEIRELLVEGIRDAVAIGARCGAGEDCGTCIETIEELIRAQPRAEEERWRRHP